ncbi:MAG: hypothetical protein C4519_05030 [Desulfobacteraceae bacterium]|nr:MAG: hypothetical protein C4519_05030 [Desulfobacteraceae bacterium]
MIFRFLKSRTLTILAITVAAAFFGYQAYAEDVEPLLFLPAALPLVTNLFCCLLDTVGRRKLRTPKNWAFALFHAAILVVAAGGLLSYATRTAGYVRLAKEQEVIDHPRQYEHWSTRLLSRPGTGMAIMVKDIVVEHWPSRELKELQTAIEIVAPAGGIERHTLAINEPLSYRGLIISLTGFYGPAALFTLQGPDGPVRGTVTIPLRGPGRFKLPEMLFTGTMEVIDFENKQLRLILMSGGRTLVDTVLSEGDTIRFEGQVLQLNHVTLWSGLAVVSDPWRYLVYAGFLLFLAGIIVFYRYQLAERQSG